MTTNETKLLRTRYCLRNEKPEDVYGRVGNALSLGDKDFGLALSQAMLQRKFFPNSPAIRNAGRQRGMFHACFALPIEDTMDSIFTTVYRMAKIFQYGGGVGINFSALRPKGASLSNGGVSSGVVSFMKIFDDVTGTVKQGGYRRGALMGILNCDHPEIMEFVRAKLRDQLSNFNLSVMITNAFMEKVESGGKIQLTHGGTRYSPVKARDLLDLICFCAWHCGDPGILFLDRINADNPYVKEFIIDITNPCFTGETKVVTPGGDIAFKDLVGKEALVYSYDGEKIVIGRMHNIRKTGTKREIWRVTIKGREKVEEIFVTPDHLFMLRDGTYRKVRDLQLGDSLMPLNRYKRNSKGYRQISLKVVSNVFHGYEDVYDGEVDGYNNFAISQGVIVHNCSEVALPPFGACCLGSINLSELVKNGQFDEEEWAALCALGTRTLLNMNALGWFPLPEVYDSMNRFNPIGLGVMGFADALIKMGVKYDSEEALQFIDLLSTHYKEVTDQIAPTSLYHRIIAPTGSLSILGDCSSGIEPIFDRQFTRFLTEDIGAIEEKRELYRSENCRTAQEVSWEWHLKVQAKFQSIVDGGISKTINLSTDATVEEIRQIYIEAWKAGVKGITVFRDGCKEGVLKSVKCEGESCAL